MATDAVPELIKRYSKSPSIRKRRVTELLYWARVDVANGLLSVKSNFGENTMRVLSSTLALAALLSSQHVMAQDTNQGGNRFTTVSYAHLNIHSEVGARVLLGRLKMAARIVCGPEPSAFELKERLAFAACQKKALDGAVAEVGSPELANLYGTAAGQLAQK